MQTVTCEFLLLLYKGKRLESVRFIHSSTSEPFINRNILPIRAIRTTRNNVGLTKNFAIISPNVCPAMIQSV